MLQGAELKTSVIDITMDPPAMKAAAPRNPNSDSKPTSLSLMSRSITRTPQLQSLLIECLGIWKNNGDRNLRLHITGIAKPTNGRLVSIDVFLDDSGQLTPTDPSYVGGYTYFANDHHGMPGNAVPIMVFELRNPMMAMKNLAKSDLFSSPGPINIFMRMTVDGVVSDEWEVGNAQFSMQLDS